MDRDRDFSASPLREGLSVPVVKQQRAHSQPNIREGLASLNEQLCNTMLGVVLGGGGGSQMRSSSGAAVAATAAARATSVSPSVVSQSTVRYSYCTTVQYCTTATYCSR